MDDKTLKIAFVTVPDEETAVSIARDVVEKRLAACVNVLPGVRSIYRWEGKTEESLELLLLLKTTSSAVEALKSRVAALHPYETPEFICVDVAAGLEKYCAWVRDECD